jgi:hexulose-6-phosphate isomerase
VNELIKKIGFMQGRLSPMVDGKIQSFPGDTWQEEFGIAKDLNFSLMEWTLDQEGLYENPLMNKSGHQEIFKLCSEFEIHIDSLTGDCFMQAPFWKVEKNKSSKLKDDFVNVCKNCSEIGISILVVPLVDNGRIDNIEQENILINFLRCQEEFLFENNIRIAFESDFIPQELKRFIGRLNADVFGVNYDIGNSAALGFDPKEEFENYGHRILNVHIKDRILAGTTVPLGNGNANFSLIYSSLQELDYKGNYILQTARAVDGEDAECLSLYQRQTIEWLKKYAV